jgi:hypothetical protein
MISTEKAIAITMSVLKVNTKRGGNKPPQNAKRSEARFSEQTSQTNKRTNKKYRDSLALFSSS